MAAPLYELATKGMDFKWTARRDEAFEQLKTALTRAPVLGFPREKGQWYVDTDASDVGAVLSQVQDGEERVVPYVSKSLKGSKQHYCTARKELLAVVQALKHFKCYLYGQKITTRTDYSAVSWLHRSKDPVGQPARWIEVIDTYDITFQHRPGRKHGNADVLLHLLCRQCRGECKETPPQGIRAVKRSHTCEPGWAPEEWPPSRQPTRTWDLSSDGSRWVMTEPPGRTYPQSRRIPRSYGVSGNRSTSSEQYYTGGSTS